MTTINDAFSNGQVDSKLWLCKELEKIFERIDNIWIYGGWYGLTAFLLRIRNNIKIEKIYSYDINPECEKNADLINENWVIKNWQFKSFTQDCNNLKPSINLVDLVINTSTEHFEKLDWWNNIPVGMNVVLQGNNMNHEDHCFKFDSLSNFVEKFKLTETYYQGEIDFTYPKWNFTRYMLIGKK